MKPKAVSHKEVFRKYYKDPEYIKAGMLIKPYYDLFVAFIKNRKKLGISRKKLGKFLNKFGAR